MCNRCQSKWEKIIDGSQPYLFHADGHSDLLKKHVAFRLGDYKELASQNRRDVCETALLEVHKAWITHNGEVEQK